MYVKHVRQKASNNMINSNSRSSNKEALQFKLQITPNFNLSSLKNSIYSHFELRKVQLSSNQWNFDLTVFKLTVYFNIGKIGKWQRFSKKFELSGTSI